MAAVSLFWDTNMAAVTSCENTLFLLMVEGVRKIITPVFMIYEAQVRKFVHLYFFYMIIFLFQVFRVVLSFPHVSYITALNLCSSFKTLHEIINR